MYHKSKRANAICSLPKQCVATLMGGFDPWEKCIERRSSTCPQGGPCWPAPWEKKHNVLGAPDVLE